MTPFSLESDRFDQHTFVGRVMHFYHMIDPRMLLVTSDQLMKAQTLLARFRAEGITQDTDHAELWEARKKLDAVVHPQLNTVIPAPFRLSGFIPFW